MFTTAVTMTDAANVWRAASTLDRAMPAPAPIQSARPLSRSHKYFRSASVQFAVRLLFAVMIKYTKRRTGPDAYGLWSRFQGTGPVLTANGEAAAGRACRTARQDGPAA